MDNFNCPYPARAADPNEPGVYAHYTMADGEIAQFQRILNRHATYGAAYNLITRTGTPGVGLAGGIYVNNDANSHWQGPAVLVGAVNFSYATEMEVLSSVAVGHGVFWNGTNVGGRHRAAHVNNGIVYISLDDGVTWSATPYTLTGRGRFRVGALYDGASQILTINGRQADADACVSVAPAGWCRIGSHGEVTRAKAYGIRRTVAQERADYVREFARVLISSWRPERVGEGPAGGIPTGAVGEGDWFAASGAAGLRFDYVRSARLANGAALALVNAGVLGAERLAFMTPKSPAFGSWSWAFLAPDLTCQPMFGLAPYRTTGLTDAGGGTYYTLVQVVAGAWQATLHRDNGAAILTTTHPAVAAVGDLVAGRFSRDVSGAWRLRLIVNGVVASSAATAADVTYLDSSYVVAAPRKAQVLGWTRHQAEAEPDEVPVPRW